MTARAPRRIAAGPAMRAALSKDEAAHKFDHGHALVLSGGSGRTGAARLAARGALRIGAGLVTLGVPGSAQMEVATQVTAIMLRRCDDAAALSGLLEDPRLNALCLGPGLGLDRARDLVPAALADPARSVVLDADALSGFADAPEVLFDALHGKCVLTPHGGEFARLFGAPGDDRLAAVRRAAARSGAVVLLKGAETVIAAPDGTAAISAATGEAAAPWLATAGAGDVLAGIITGLLARGIAPLEAAGYGAWLHAEAARQVGPGLIAEDLPEVLPRVLKRLGC
ncbi:NAD(P)H-hydrate dehydratase [Roseivivax sp. THAF197b]|uniref:NAD(P)H-hydrate dehydratase n=1 Tax=Roseivivax sp. THAF197b TaxID=2588299 RepID=UPI0012AA8875|nr:NAD(P)H-hydrate dehydratase [Roseivivax sp. THAF197b]QFS82736.1 Bifunctional NAD(P)H-hydrate repair enzyme Nnr [Roseivivax sp. THAF197b]